MQTRSLNSISRPFPQGKPQTPAKFRGHLEPSFSVPLETKAPLQGVEQLNVNVPISEQQLEAIGKSKEVQKRVGEGAVTGIRNGLQVITNHGEWRRRFDTSKALQGQSENIFDQLSSLLHLILARFNEAIVAKIPEPTPVAQVEATPTPPKQSWLDWGKEKLNLSNSTHTELQSGAGGNPVAFMHYQQVIQKYPNLALETDTTLPFDLGEQAIQASANPTAKRTQLNQVRNQLVEKLKIPVEKKQSGQLSQEAFQNVLSEVLRPINAKVQRIFEKID